MHRIQSGGWPYSEDGRDSSKALSLRVAVLRTAVFRSLRMCSCGSLHGSLKLAMHGSMCNCRVFVVVVVVPFVYLFSVM